MSTTYDAAPATARRGQSTLLSAVVAVGVVVGWLAYDHWVYPRLSVHVDDLRWVRSNFALLTLVDLMVKYFAPYALVLLVWGRTSGRRVGGASCALATGLYVWGVYQLFDHWIWAHHPGQAANTAYSWANLLVICTGVALAWGIARRWGRVWPVGLVVAPALAALAYELELHSPWWRVHVLATGALPHGVAHDLVLFAPAIVAAVVCWLIDAATTRRTTS